MVVVVEEENLWSSYARSLTIHARIARGRPWWIGSYAWCAKKGEKEKLLFSRPPYIVAISHPRFRPVSAGRVKEEEISVRNDNEGATSYHPSSRDFFSFFLTLVLRHLLTRRGLDNSFFFTSEAREGRGIFSWMHLGGCNQAWRSFRAGNCVTSLIRWRVVNRGQCTRPTFLAGHYNARFTGVGLVCVCSCTQGCAAVHVRALHRKIPGVRIKFSSLCECS